ncbi:hypothetical protein TNCV_2069891 [Trichonephila clavipes]|uniref:Uncharacterized protein n=1 Tax=Trichonephila clavipes TaxID=2585209 RepID=A0A8X6W3B9_TRICX|nr:hypothetical protein TNCV_2069891 [Trichonephila clavipes]
MLDEFLAARCETHLRMNFEPRNDPVDLVAHLTLSSGTRAIECVPAYPKARDVGLIFWKVSLEMVEKTATAGSDVVQSGRPIFDDFFLHLWPYIGNNTANVVFQMVKRLWLIRIDQ